MNVILNKHAGAAAFTLNFLILTVMERISCKPQRNCCFNGAPYKPLNSFRHILRDRESCENLQPLLRLRASIVGAVLGNGTSEVMSLYLVSASVPGCHLYSINTHHGSELRIVAAIRNKLLLITRKHSRFEALNAVASGPDSPVEEFQYIRVQQTLKVIFFAQKKPLCVVNA